VPHHNSVFHAMLRHLPWDELDAAVARHDAAGCARRFSFKSQVVAMLYAQVSGAASLRHVVGGLRSGSPAGWGSSPGRCGCCARGARRSE